METVSLMNESDVEQKIVLPLIINEYPNGLGFTYSDFRTKLDLRKVTIDKGNKRALYYPDYLIIINGLPVIIIEVKAPGEDLIIALKEARLYASEINSSYPAHFNPCNKLIASNGTETIAAFWDNDTELIKFQNSETDIINTNYFQFLNFCSKKATLEYITNLQKGIRKNTKFSKPTMLLGGRSIQNMTIGENSFGSNVSIEYRYLFNPETQDERIQIAHNAYVASKRKLSHVNPIDKLIRATLTPSYKEARLINSDNPVEIVNSISDSKRIKHQVLLLIGSVGSGKSTFIDYLKEVALSEELKSRTFWLTVDMNNSPASKDFIYSWFLENALEKLYSTDTGYDLKEFNTLQKIFAHEISEFNRGPISMFDKESEKYRNELYDLLVNLTKDKTVLFRAITNYIFVSRGKSLIIVLDNVDKRDRDTQLLMFEVANWLKSTFHCSIFLPLREVTFDSYRNEKPLDTVIKDFVFRIEPPLLDQVIYKRLNYAIREVEYDKSYFNFYISNGARVECKRSEVINYISSIIKTLFQNNFFKKLITGLSERDIRKGLEIFLDFCKSGHIQEEEIVKMRFSGGGEYELPNHLVTRILLRGNRRYYSDLSSPVKNIFFSDPNDDIPDPFVRLSILNWLKEKFREIGPNKTKGYHKISTLVRDLMSIGHSENRILNELETLIKANCVLTETQSIDLDSENLVSITSAGFVHLDLLLNIDYLSTIAEDTWFRDLRDAEKVRDNIAGKIVSSQKNKDSSLESAITLINSLENYKDYFPVNPSAFLNQDDFLVYKNLTSSKKLLDDAVQTNPTFGHIQALIEQYPKGSIVEGQITSIQNYGLFVEFGLNGKGFVHISEIISYSDPSYLEENFEIGEKVSVEIIEFQKQHERFRLSIP